MSNRPVKLGIIGCGNVLDAYLPQCEKLRLHGEAEVVIACGRKHQRDRALGLGAPKFTTDESTVLEASDVDAVLILASMPEHARLTRAALEAGKHVLVEKPLATELPEAAPLISLAKARERILLCAPFVILSPTFRTISRHIQAGDIGKPCSARARYGWAGPSWTEWFYRPGGGCLFDLGVYCITSLTGLLGPAKRVIAMTGVAIPEREIGGRRIRVEAEDNAQVLLDFGEGCFGVVTSGFTIQQYRCPAIEVYGTEGSIQMLGDDWDPDGYELWQNTAGCWKVFKETEPDWHWTAGLLHFVECIRTGATPLVTPEHAYHVLEIMLNAQKSGREWHAAPIESTFARPQFAPAVTHEPTHLVHDRSRQQH